MAIELGMPEVPHFAMNSGAVVNTLSWTMQRSGLLTATVGLIAQGEAVDGRERDGATSDLEMVRFGQFNGAVERNGAALGSIVSAQITYSNNLDRIETIRNDGMIEGADPSIAALTGTIEVRFANQTLLNQAVDGDAAELRFSFTRSASEAFELVAHAVYLPKPRLPIQGPAGRAGELRVAGGAGVRRRAHVHGDAEERRARTTTTRPDGGASMIRLDLASEPRWVELGHGVRVQGGAADQRHADRRARGSGGARAARGGERRRAILVFCKAVARRVILDWEGVGDAEGTPIAPTPEGIDALLDLYPLFQAWEAGYVGKGLALVRKKTPPRPRRVIAYRERKRIMGVMRPAEAVDAAGRADGLGDGVALGDDGLGLRDLDRPAVEVAEAIGFAGAQDAEDAVDQAVGDGAEGLLVVMALASSSAASRPRRARDRSAGRCRRRGSGRA